MLRVPVGRLAPADEAFVANRHACAGSGRVEAIRDRRFPRTKERMLLEPPRHDDLARRIDLSELAAAAVGRPVRRTNRDAPLAANLEVRLPVCLTIEVGMSPPSFNFIGR